MQQTTSRLQYHATSGFLPSSLRRGHESNLPTSREKNDRPVKRLDFVANSFRACVDHIVPTP